MKNRKVLIVSVAVALALVGAGVAIVGTNSVRAPVDAKSVRVPAAAKSDRVPVDAKSVRVAAVSAFEATNAFATATAPATQTPTRRGTLPFVLSSRAPFTKPLRLAAEALGAKTVSPLSRTSVLVEADEAARARLKADARFADVVEFAPAEKIQPALAALVEKGEKTVEVSIVSLDEIDRETVIAALEAAGGEMLKGCINEGVTIRAKIPSDLVATLAGRGEVRWMERFVRPEFTNDQAVKSGAMDVTGVWDDSRRLGLTGAGQKITTSDSGIDTGIRDTLHLDLRDRVKAVHIVAGCDTADYNGHGTHTAGSIVGDGSNCDGKYRGTAHGADLYAWFCGAGGGRYVYTPDKAADLFRPNDVDAYIHSASWGSGYESGICGDYTTLCADYDGYVWRHPDFLPVFSAGNDGEYGSGTIGSPGSAKNILAVGATVNLPGDPSETAYFSSRGPCKDGRVKPDVAAPGHSVCSTRSSKDGGGVVNGYTSMSGTSMSCPLTAGSVALVRQWLVEKRHYDGKTEISAGVTNQIPTAALMKAVVMGGAYGAETPGNAQGWGRVKLADTLAPTDGRDVLLVDRIPFAQDFVTNIVIETTNAAPLDVQLVWVDYPGSSSGSQATPRLVNDLDLTVETYGSAEDVFCYGNGGDEPDALNNAESVRLATAPKAKYIVTVDCKSILHDHTEGGAAALYIRGAFDPAAKPEAPKCVHLEQAGEDFFSLDDALEAVREDGETVKILRPTRLSRPVAVPANCTIVAEAAEPDVAPVVRCSAKALLAVPENVTVSVAGVAFTNDCAGLEVAGSLALAAGTSFSSLAGVGVSSNGVLSLDGFAVSGGTADWSVEGALTLANALLASNQTVTVAADGRLTIGDGVTNLVRVTLAEATTNSLTLAGVLTREIAVDAPTACAQGDAFGRFTGDYEAACATAKRLFNVHDMDLGGVPVANGVLKWGLVTVDLADAYCVVSTNGTDLAGYRTFSAALRAVAGANGTIAVAKDVTHTNAVTLAHDLTLVSTNGAALAFGKDAGFVVPAGTRLTVTNLTATGAGAKLADCAFKVTGGELVLEDGATLMSFANEYLYQGKPWGGAVAVTAGSVTMKSGARIENCTAHAGAAGGGAIFARGATAEVNLLGGTITRCAAATGGAVYVDQQASVVLEGDFAASDNTKLDGTTPSNLYFSPNADFTLTDALDGAVGVSFGASTPSRNALGAAFVTLGSGVTELAARFSAAKFSNDADATLVGVYDETLGTVVWGEPAAGDGQCDQMTAGVRVQVDGEDGYRYYPGVDEAFANVKEPATFEVAGYRLGRTPFGLDWGLDAVTRDAAFDCDARLTTWTSWTGLHQPIGTAWLWRSGPALYRVNAGATLTLTNILVTGACGYENYDYRTGAFDPLFDADVGLVSVKGGSLVLEDSAGIGIVSGAVSRASNAVTVYNGGSLAMEPGSYVAYGWNYFESKSDATGCGGGILLDKATAHFRGGTVRDSFASRAGGVYVANGSTAYVSGGFTAESNTDLAGATNNFVVSQNSQLVLAGAFTGSVGVNEGIACDTNAFATVSADWAWSVDALTNSAARFFHDVRRMRGAAVTNGTSAILVWSDWLSKAGSFAKDGKVYRVCLAPGQIVAVPQPFSVGTKASACGKTVLSLDGVEGCWYTVYSTEDLTKPFAAEKSIQLKKGETFEYEIDPTKGAKFYKVVAEEGLK